MTERLDPLTQHTPRAQVWAASWFLVAATAMALPVARAADTSAAAASALKVLSTPLNGANIDSAPAGNAPTTNAPAGTLITVQKGENIDAVLRRGLPGIPLKEELLRQALAKANPKIFPKGQTYPVRPGTVLTLPSVEALRQHILAQSPQAAALFQVTASVGHAEETTPGPDKRRWVRFP